MSDRGPRTDEAVSPPSLAAEGLCLSYDRRQVVHELDLVVAAGQITVIVGANGCGKSTLLRGLGRLLKPAAGRVRLGGVDVWSMSPRRVAAVLGVLPQQPVAPEGISVADLVGRGRYPHQGLFRRWTSDDDRIVADALDATGTADLADRRIEELSGGQRQRVWIAMSLAQQPRIVLLDEPTTYLDVAHQLDVLDLIADLNHRASATVVMVLHDLNLAARYADHLVVMADGRILIEGHPADILTDTTVTEAFGLTSLVIPDPVTGRPMVIPIGNTSGRSHSAKTSG